jgi:MFS family permease
MVFEILSGLIDLVFQIENPFEGRPVEEWFDIPSMVLWVFGWIFLGLGITAFLVLVVYTKYGREASIRLSVITIIIASIFLAFAFHFLLLNFGY